MAIATTRNSKSSGTLTSSRVLDNQIRVATPENISFQYEVSGPFRRLLAYVGDVLITVSVFALIAFVISITLGMLQFAFRNTPVGGLLDLFQQVAGGVILVSAFLSLWFYGAFMETNYNGQTFGKMMASIRTISVDGSSIDASQAALRNFFRLLDVSPFISLGLIFGPELGYHPLLPIFSFGLACMVLSGRFQRIGDLVAGTIVITEERKWTHGLAKFHDKRVPELADLIPESFVVSQSLAKTLAEFVDRRRVLPQQRVNEIANHLGKSLIELFELPNDTNSDLLLCALYQKTFLADAKLEGNSELLPGVVADEVVMLADDSDGAGL